MASSSVIEIESLVAPIEGDNPAGNNIREDVSPTSIYYKIKDARSGARTSERQLQMDDDPEAANIVVPEWQTVLTTAPEILKSHAKDLEVAAWYTEGLLREYGVAGLRDGFRLIHKLIEGFWDNLYPMPDEDGIETRVAPLIGLNGDGGEGTLMVPINKIPLTQAGTYSSFAMWHYEQAQDLEKIVDAKKKEARKSAGAITLEMIQQGVLETPVKTYEELTSDVNECIEAFAQMTAALDQLCGHDSPPSSNISNRLNRLKEVLVFLTKGLAKPAAPVAQEGSSDVEADVAVAQAAAATVSVGDGTISSREEAHRTMLKIADFFRETEPHSPVSYVLEQAVRWGNMTLPELLSELISDDRARQDYFKVTGIPVEDKKRK